MTLRIFAALLMLASPARAWVFGSEAPATGWVTYVAGVSERARVARPQFSTPLTWVSFSGYVQSVRVYLGTVKTNTPIPAPFGAEVGPAICETNINAGVTNIVCWTNYASLDTDYKREDLIFEKTFGLPPDPNGGPYGAQIATNLMWTNSDPRLAGFVSLHGSITVTPSRALLLAVDNDLMELVPRFYDINEMRRVAGSNLSGRALLEAYLSAPTGTNWLWTDNNGDPDDGSGNAWYATNAYPSGPPLLTLSNAWKWAGIPVIRYVSSITTNVRQRFGWEDDKPSLLYSGYVTNITTNWAEVYRFENSPTQRPWSALLRHASLIETSIVDQVVTTAVGVVTATTLHIDFIDVRGQAFLDDILQHDSAFVVAGRGMTNDLTIHPPVEWTNIAETIRPFDIEIVGSLAMISDQYFRVISPSTVTVSSSEAVLTNDIMWIDLSRAIAAANPGTTSYFWSVGSISSSNFPIREEVWTNGVIPSNSVIGMSMEVHARGSYFASPDPSVGFGAYTTNDLAQRLRILSQLQWSPLYEPEGAQDRLITDGWADNNYYRFWHDVCGISTWPDSATNTCDAFPVPEDFVVGDYASAAAPAHYFMAGDFYHQQYPIVGGYETWRQWSAGGYSETRSAYFLPEIEWPDSISITGRLFEAGPPATIDVLGRLAIVSQNPYQYPYVPMTNHHVRPRRVSCDEYEMITNEVVFAGDPFGPDQLWVRLWGSSVDLPRGTTGFLISDIDFASGIRPIDLTLVADTIVSDVTCVDPFDSVRTREEWTRIYVQPVDRALRDFGLVMRWKFDHAPDGD